MKVKKYLEKRLEKDLSLIAGYVITADEMAFYMNMAVEEKRKIDLYKFRTFPFFCLLLRLLPFFLPFFLASSKYRKYCSILVCTVFKYIYCSIFGNSLAR